jgi:N6-L-threonylcarbamoyladenine synthase
MSLGYPGGPIIGKLAETGNSKRYPLPRPMLDQDNYDFSFSGLKTAAIELIKREKDVNKNDFAASLQAAIIEPLVEKTVRAAEKFQTKTVLLAGGVSANSALRKEMEKRITKDKLFIPSPGLCTDNAAYIAARAFFTKKTTPWQKIQANPGLEIEEMI